MNKIERACIRVGDTLVHLPAPARHNDVLRHGIKAGLILDDVKERDRGFMDSEGNFLSRQEALRVAFDAGQTVKLPKGSAVLTTEDVW